ncbi:hypothetical protein D3C73_1128190 [compost metagenome]
MLPPDSLVVSSTLTSVENVLAPDTTVGATAVSGYFTAGSLITMPLLRPCTDAVSLVLSADFSVPADPFSVTLAGSALQVICPSPPSVKPEATRLIRSFGARTTAAVLSSPSLVPSNTSSPGLKEACAFQCPLFRPAGSDPPTRSADFTPYTLEVPAFPATALPFASK